MPEERSRRIYVFLFAVAILMTMVGLFIGVRKPNPNQPTAADMLPDLDGYTIVEGSRLTDYIGKLSGGAALLSGHPELAVTIAAVDHVIGCYQDVGAVQARLYSNQTDPLSCGTIAIADRNQLLDPDNLFKCVTPAIPEDSDPPLDRATIEPCTASYKLSKDDNAFYIIYAGTTQEICLAFCAALEGCEQQQ